ncbi:MAG: hypothetical protein ACPGUV_03690, partial [Polyangiales bacterium]
MFEDVVALASSGSESDSEDEALDARDSDADMIDDTEVTAEQQGLPPANHRPPPLEKAVDVNWTMFAPATVALSDVAAGDLCDCTGAHKNCKVTRAIASLKKPTAYTRLDCGRIGSQARDPPSGGTMMKLVPGLCELDLEFAGWSAMMTGLVGRAGCARLLAAATWYLENKDAFRTLVGKEALEEHRRPGTPGILTADEAAMPAKDLGKLALRPALQWVGPAFLANTKPYSKDGVEVIWSNGVRLALAGPTGRTFIRLVYVLWLANAVIDSFGTDVSESLEYALDQDGEDTEEAPDAVHKLYTVIPEVLQNARSRCRTAAQIAAHDQLTKDVDNAVAVGRLIDPFAVKPCGAGVQPSRDKRHFGDLISDMIPWLDEEVPKAARVISSNYNWPQKTWEELDVDIDYAECDGDDVALAGLLRDQDALRLQFWRNFRAFYRGLDKAPGVNDLGLVEAMESASEVRAAKVAAANHRARSARTAQARDAAKADARRAKRKNLFVASITRYTFVQEGNALNAVKRWLDDNYADDIHFVACRYDALYFRFKTEATHDAFQENLVRLHVHPYRVKCVMPDRFEKLKLSPADGRKRRKELRERVWTGMLQLSGADFEVIVDGVPVTRSGSDSPLWIRKRVPGQKSPNFLQRVKPGVYSTAIHGVTPGPITGDPLDLSDFVQMAVKRVAATVEDGELLYKAYTATCMGDDSVYNLTSRDRDDIKKLVQETHVDAFPIVREVSRDYKALADGIWNQFAFFAVCRDPAVRGLPPAARKDAVNARRSEFFKPYSELTVDSNTGRPAIVTDVSMYTVSMLPEVPLDWNQPDPTGSRCIIEAALMSVKRKKKLLNMFHLPEKVDFNSIRAWENGTKLVDGEGNHVRFTEEQLMEHNEVAAAIGMLMDPTGPGTGEILCLVGAARCGKTVLQEMAASMQTDGSEAGTCRVQQPGGKNSDTRFVFAGIKGPNGNRRYVLFPDLREVPFFGNEGYGACGILDKTGAGAVFTSEAKHGAISTVTGVADLASSTATGASTSWVPNLTFSGNNWATNFQGISAKNGAPQPLEPQHWRRLMVLLFSGGGPENKDFARLAAMQKPRGHVAGDP